MMEEALITLLLGDPALRDQVGEEVNWNERPQGGPQKCVVLRLVGDLPDYTMTGPGGLVQSRVQVDCLADKTSGALAVKRALVARVSGFKGVVRATRFDGIFIVGGGSDFSKDGPDKWVRNRVDLMVWAGPSA